MNPLFAPLQLGLKAAKLPFDIANSLLGNDKDPRKEAAEEIRTEAAERAEQRKADAEKRRQEAVARAKRNEQQRKQQSAKTTAAVADVVDERAKRDRVSALDEKADALRAEEKALTAKDEAARLEKAAGRIKAQR